MSHLNVKAKKRHGHAPHDSHVSSEGDKGKCVTGRLRLALISKRDVFSMSMMDADKSAEQLLVGCVVIIAPGGF